MKPEKIKNGITFYPVPEFDYLAISFGADGSAFFNRRNLPDVPQKYEDKARELMFKGGALVGLSEKIDKMKASNAITAWLRSFEPAHEAKMITVAYALWLWSDDDALDMEAK